MFFNTDFFYPKINGYIAIIGDIKNSRNSQDREKIQLMLNRVLEKINADYKEKIAAQFVITLGITN